MENLQTLQQLYIDPLRSRARGRRELLHRQRVRQIQQSESEHAEQRLKLKDSADEATRDPYIWATKYTKTSNPHWVEEGRESAFEPFPSYEEYPHLYDLFELLKSERIYFFEKSRDMMVSWGCVAYLTNRAMVVPAREVLFQTQKEKKVRQLIKYARCLYEQQPQWLKDAFPLGAEQSNLALTFAHGGGVYGIPGGADQIRLYHPWAYLNDESSFQADAGECFNESLSAVSGLIVFNSSAGPGWFSDVRHDVILDAEE
jgi:hypothetical protein